MKKSELLLFFSLVTLLGIAWAGEGYRSPSYGLKESKTTDVPMKEASFESNRMRVQTDPEPERMMASEEKTEPTGRDPKSDNDEMRDEIKKMEEERWGSPKEPSFKPTYWRYDR